jgi:hypothetical protein
MHMFVGYKHLVLIGLCHFFIWRDIGSLLCQVAIFAKTLYFNAGTPMVHADLLLFLGLFNLLDNFICA